MIFGKVTSGMNVVRMIENRCGTQSGTPKQIVKIERCGIIEKPPSDSEKKEDDAAKQTK